MVSSQLCTSVDKEGEGGKNVDDVLMCYEVKSAKTAPPQSKHVPVPGIFVNNQFGRERISTLKEDELCVPSTEMLP